ncbi:MAG: hypothetical protein LC772_07215 [Chloroflexi bacterium]|nr:hypothetical protein [Chloroflexota bacterium]
MTEVQASGSEAGNPDEVVRAESTLARWEDGLALFRVRVTRADGAVAEAHGAAHDGESETFWQLAEDRALARARQLLQQLAPLTPGALPTLSRPVDESLRPPAAPAARPAVSGASSSPGQGSAPQHSPASRPASNPGGRDAAGTGAAARPPAGTAARPVSPPGTPEPQRTAEPQRIAETRRPADPRVSESPSVEEDPTAASRAGATPQGAPVESPRGPATSKPGANVGTPSTRSQQADHSSASEDDIPDPFLPDDDPFEDADPRPNGASPPSSGATGARRPPARQDTAGTAAPQQRVSPARTTPAPNPQRCSYPGCNVPLTPAQVTHSMHHHGQPLCPAHARKG